MLTRGMPAVPRGTDGEPVGDRSRASDLTRLMAAIYPGCESRLMADAVPRHPRPRDGHCPGVAAAALVHALLALP